MPEEAIYAMTSLPPNPADPVYLEGCIRSWRDAGLEVRSFNHPSEIPHLERRFEIDFVPVTTTSSDVFGGHFIPVRAMLEWAAARDTAVLLINADIQLKMSRCELKRLRWLCDGGVCCVFRYNHEGETTLSSKEPHGIDAFLLHGRDAGLFSESFLSVGQPFWDYWIPQQFMGSGRSLYCVEFPVAFHRNHARKWSWDNWYRCALEFDRLTGLLGADKSFDRCHQMCAGVRNAMNSAKKPIHAVPTDIRQWAQARFAYRGPKTFLELGAHTGTDTDWLARIPDVTIHAFEPDPRNHPAHYPNVHMHRAAIAGHNGRVAFLLSREGWGREWTYSSSIRQPKHHLQWFPVTFGPTIEVDAVSLDSFTEKFGLGLIDFVWADIQGAEGDMIRGGRDALARTRYLYTEYSDDELYDGQVSLKEMMAMLPDYRVIELWPNDVLLENQRLTRDCAAR
jgi:2-O-methyltransferase